MDPRHFPPSAIWRAVIAGVLVFALAAFGIATRQTDLLAVFWPANAVLLGLFVRWPAFVRWTSWVAAAFGYLAADLLTGGTIGMALILATANLSGVGAGIVVHRHFARHDPERGRSLAVLGLFATSLAGAAGAAIVGATIAPQTLDAGWFEGLGFWLANEFTNYMLILPLFLLLPMPATARDHVRMRLERDPVTELAPPIVTLVLSIGASAVIGGPGAIAFPVPALIWCCMLFSPWVISIFNFLMGMFFLVATTSGWLVLGSTDTSTWETVSLRFGVALLTLGPLTLSEIERDRRYAMDNLKELATQDSLTAVMNRRAFDLAAVEIMERARRGNRPVALMMMDVDHFKQVNDTHGHLAGDLVLTRLASLMSMTLPESAVVGRVGGEEFAAIVPNLDERQSYELADRIRSRIEGESAKGSAYNTLGATVSIGVAWEVAGGNTTLTHLMESADFALYEAKGYGRNHVVLAGNPGEMSHPVVASA